MNETTTNDPIEIESVIEKNKQPDHHTVRIINGIPTCISCKYNHSIKLPNEKLKELAEQQFLVI